MIPTIVFLDRASFQAPIELVKPNLPHHYHWIEYDHTPPEKVVERAQNADVILVNKVVINQEIIDKLPKLKMVSVTATGTNNIDLEHCANKSIMVTNVTDYGTPSIAEHTIMLILALKRKLVAYREKVIEGRWSQSDMFCYYDNEFPVIIRELKGSKLGILGTGSIGKEVARLGLAFGMEVSFLSHKNQTEINISAQSQNQGQDQIQSQSTQSPAITCPCEPLEKLLATSQVISLHLPLTPQSNNLIAARELRLMNNDTILINTSRGGIVNEADLVTAVKNQLISGVGFDVLTNEPPRASNPLLEIADYPNVIITPHIAWAGQQSAENLLRLAIKNIEIFYSKLSK